MKHLLTLAGLVLLTAPARATWSIVAVDEASREVGIAAASCSVGVALIAGVVPGKGVVAAQAATSFTGRDLATRMIAEGADAARVLSALEDPALYRGWFTIGFSRLQYGVATLAGEVRAGHVEGDATPDETGGVVGPTYSVQGNTLRPGVVEETARAYREADGPGVALPLAERLLRALEAGRDAGGDRRCPPEAPALAAILYVARPGDSAETPTLELATPRRFSLARVLWHLLIPYRPDPARPEPVAELRRRYEGRGARSNDPRAAPPGAPS